MLTAHTYNCLVEEALKAGLKFAPLDDTPLVVSDAVEIDGRRVELNNHFYVCFAPEPGQNLEVNYVAPALMSLGRSVKQFADAAALATTTEFSFGKTVHLDTDYLRGHTKAVCVNGSDGNVLVIDGIVYGIAIRQGDFVYLDRPLDKDVTTDSIATVFTSPVKPKTVTIVTANLAGQAELVGDTWVRFGSRIHMRGDVKVDAVIIDILAGFLVDN